MIECDVVLIGTGVAPLVAAHALMAQGKKILLLNPDPDFFLENSEFSLDPLLPLRSLIDGQMNRLRRCDPEEVVEDLKPTYPGSLEYTSCVGGKSGGGFHDPLAPHVRHRGRLWLTDGASGVGVEPTSSTAWSWELLEELFLKTSDLGLHPQIWDGLAAVRRFPGVSHSFSSQSFRGLYLPKSYDVDVSRYRNGLLEFVRERLGPERVLCGASPISFENTGDVSMVRWYGGYGGAFEDSEEVRSTQAASIKERALIFWTPRLSRLMAGFASQLEYRDSLDREVRMWEEWSLLSRERLDPSTIGMYREMVVWVDMEGQEQRGQILNVLRPVDQYLWGSGASFEALSVLCREFLRWDRLCVRSMKPRLTFVPHKGDSEILNFSKSPVEVQVVRRSDGPLVEVVRRIQKVCEAL